MYIIAKHRLATAIVRSFIECFVKLQSDPMHHGVKPFLIQYLYIFSFNSFFHTIYYCQIYKKTRIRMQLLIGYQPIVSLLLRLGLVLTEQKQLFARQMPQKEQISYIQLEQQKKRTRRIMMQFIYAIQRSACTVVPERKSFY